MDYQPQRNARSQFFALRQHRYHVLQWGQGQAQTPLVMVHGWMDVGASYQFLVDALSSERPVYAADWRGFGLTEGPATDSYWFADYIADLDALLDQLSPEAPVDLLGHSMGGNVVMNYAGVRPQRVRKLINLEGFGLPRSPAELAPLRMAQWLDALKQAQRLKPYADLEEVAQRLCRTNPLLAPSKARWLAQHWAQPAAQGGWTLRADPAHKRPSPLLYRVEEQLAAWAAIEAPMLFVEGDQSDLSVWWGQRYSKAEFHERLNVVRNVQRQQLSPAGHMLHHDQPQALARCIEAFLDT